MIQTIKHRWLHVPYQLHVNQTKTPRRSRATVLFLHGIGNNSHAWDTVIATLPDDVRCISIDLLGFGESPKPRNISYDAREHARSVLHTYLSLGIPEKIIIVGHSLGSLVAVEFAKRYPILVKSLI